MTESADRGCEALADVDAALQFVNDGLQALMDLLDGATPDTSIRAGGLRALLGPVADQAGQAAPVARMLLERRLRGVPPHPPASVQGAPVGCTARCARIGPKNSTK